MVGLGSKKELCASLKTTSEARRFVDFIDTIISESYKINDKFSVKASLPENSGKWGQLVLSLFDKPELDSDSLRSGLEELKIYVQDLSVVNISIPFNPSENFINEAYSMIEKIENQPYLIRFQVKERDSLDVGFSIHGDYLNISLKKLIRKYLVSKNVFSGNL